MRLRLILSATTAVLLVGCASPNSTPGTNATSNTPGSNGVHNSSTPPSTTFSQQEPVTTALRHLKFRIKQPKWFPFVKGASSAMITTTDNKYQRIDITYLNKSSDREIKEEVSNSQISVSGANVNVKLTNGTNAHFQSGATESSLSWSSNGLYYVLSSSKNINTNPKPDLNEIDLEKIANSMI
ncbi:hypothetical protein AAC03nite_39330 [Alicyclobacillus acidoterrestris]|nr:hypothetical protein AAC03nite_39330 [Alicyclobacillus acidoterrestris]